MRAATPVATRPLLGVIEHDYLDHASPPPALLDITTFGHPVLRTRVQGAHPERLLQADSTLTHGYVAAARELERAGARAITADCGLAVQYQDAVAAAVNIPVALSTLLLAPAVLAMVPPKRRLAIIVGDHEHFADEHRRWTGIDPADPRVVIHGMDGTRTMHAWNSPEHTTDWAIVEEELSYCGAALQHDHPEISHVLLECTGLPPAAARLRAELQLPLLDWIGLCRMPVTSVGGHA